MHESSASTDVGGKRSSYIACAVSFDSYLFNTNCIFVKLFSSFRRACGNTLPTIVYSGNYWIRIHDAARYPNARSSPQFSG